MEEVENDPTHSDEQRQLYRDRLDDLNTENQARLEMLSQNRKDLQRQAARKKQIFEKVLHKNTSLAERIRTLFLRTWYNYIFNTDCFFDDYFNNRP